MRQLLKKLDRIKSYGNSMEPLIQDGDVVHLKKISLKAIRVNDVILFRQKGSLIAHRVVYKFSKYTVTKGDANRKSDGKIYPRNIIGKVHQISRGFQTFYLDDLYLMQSTYYFQELIKIAKAFKKKRIKFVFLKGLPLHLLYEKKHPARLYSDCDILIEKKRYLDVKLILERYGFTQTNIHLRVKQQTPEVGFYKNIAGFTVILDIHIEVVFMMTKIGNFNMFYKQTLVDHLTNEFLAGAKWASINGEDFPVLSHTHLVLYLALHFFHHNLKGPLRLQFLHTVIVKTNSSDLFDPDRELTALIGRYEFASYVYPSFALLRKMYQTPIPRTFLNRIQQDVLKRIYINKIIARDTIFNEDTRVREGIKRFQNLLYLSPNPWYVKVMIFVNPQVLIAIRHIVSRYILRRLKLL